MSPTATLTRKAATLVAQEETAVRKAKVTATAQRLQVEATKAAAGAERQRQLRAADEAEAKYLRSAPVTLMTFDTLTVSIRHAGKDVQERLTISEGVRRAERLITQAFRARLGIVRNAALTGSQLARQWYDIPGLVERLHDDLRQAIRLGAVSLEVTK